MSDPDRTGTAPEPAPVPPAPSRDDNRTALVDHFLAYRDRFRRDALSRAAEDAGHAPADVTAAWEQVDAQLAGRSAPDSVVTRARLIVVALYVGTFLLLTVPTDMSRKTYSVGPLILAVLLVVTGLISLFAVGRRRRVAAEPMAALASVLAVPFILLVIVAGACVWSTSPTFFAGRQ